MQAQSREGEEEGHVGTGVGTCGTPASYHEQAGQGQPGWEEESRWLLRAEQQRTVQHCQRSIKVG